MEKLRRINWKLLLLTLAFALFVLPWVNVQAASADKNVDQADAAKEISDQMRTGFKEKAASVQLPFISNQGQVNDESVKFYARTFGGTVYVTQEGEIVYSLPKFEEKAKDAAKDKAEDRLLKHKARDESSRPMSTKGWSLKEQLVGALSVSSQGVDASQTKVNYFIGNDKSKWRSNIATYNTASLGEVYLGIDLSLRAHGNNVEKVFTVKPGADVNKIKLKIEGAVSLKVNGEGELEVGTGLGVARFTRPVAYQEKNGKREYVQVAYYLSQNTYGFTVGDYDKSRSLTIDPLLASTFIGGSNDFDCAYSLAIDSAGNVYVAGSTNSTDYPTTAGAYDTSHNWYDDVFVSKLDASLSTLLASTFIGGNYWDTAYSLVTSPEEEQWIIQVGKQTGAGEPVSRELRAIQDLENAGWRIEFVPYNE